MDLNYSQEELAFRDQVRGWLQQSGVTPASFLYEKFSASSEA